MKKEINAKPADKVSVTWQDTAMDSTTAAAEQGYGLTLDELDCAVQVYRRARRENTDQFDLQTDEDMRCLAAQSTNSKRRTRSARKGNRHATSTHHHHH